VCNSMRNSSYKTNTSKERKTTCKHKSFRNNQQDATMYILEFIIPAFLIAQHVSSDTSLIIRSSNCICGLWFYIRLWLLAAVSGRQPQTTMIHGSRNIKTCKQYCVIYWDFIRNFGQNACKKRVLIFTFFQF